MRGSKAMKVIKLEKISAKAVRDQMKSTWKKFTQALPVIVFFLFLFCTVIWIFGSHCVMVVSIVTVVFKGNYKKRQSWGSLFRVAGLQIFLCALAYVATWNLALRLILNFIIPFCLIFLKASQFNKLAYFIGSGRELPWSPEDDLCQKEKDFVRRCGGYLADAGGWAVSLSSSDGRL